jgi:hypothetical protein
MWTPALPNPIPAKVAAIGHRHSRLLVLAIANRQTERVREQA